MDACTVTALCAITAFAASKPRLTPRSAVGFFGSGGRPGRPAQPITQLTLEQLHKCCCPFLPLTELSLWLCSSRKLLRESYRRGGMYRHSLARPPLSRFLTPADTSQCSRFFRVWRLFRLPGSNRSPGLLQSGYYLLPSFSAVNESNFTLG